MTKRTRRIIFLVLTSSVVAGIVWQQRDPEPVAVTVAATGRGPVESSVANTRAGTVKACRRTRLAPAIGGQVDELLVKKGQHVTAGQALLRLWNQDLAAQLQLARSEVRASVSRHDETCLRAETAERDYARLSQLEQRGLISVGALDQARTAAHGGRAACDAARAGIEVANDQVHVAEVNLGRTILRAPYAGTVAEINGEPGEFVTPSPPGIPTPPAIDLVDTSCLYVTAPIDEVDAPQVLEGMPARITLDAFGDRVFAGRVRRIAPYVLEVEKQARTVEVEAVFNDIQAGEQLLPGYTADLEVIVEARPETLRVPTEALMEGNRVLVMGVDGVLVERKLRTGLRNCRYTEVIEGLAPGDNVVTSVERQGVVAGAHARVDATPDAATP